MVGLRSQYLSLLYPVLLGPPPPAPGPDNDNPSPWICH
jgi:hypothetical protein